jgi:hypothetical protein
MIGTRLVHDTMYHVWPLAVEVKTYLCLIILISICLQVFVGCVDDGYESYRGYDGL